MEATLIVTEDFSVTTVFVEIRPARTKLIAIVRARQEHQTIAEEPAAVIIIAKEVCIATTVIAEIRLVLHKQVAVASVRPHRR